MPNPHGDTNRVHDTKWELVAALVAEHTAVSQFLEPHETPDGLVTTFRDVTVAHLRSSLALTDWAEACTSQLLHAGDET